MSWSRITWATGLSIVSLMLGTISLASAAPAAEQPVLAPHEPVLRGEVTVIEGVGFTLHTPQGDVKVLTDGATRFHIPGEQQGTLADVRVGQQVAVRGTFERQGLMRARQVLIIPDGASVLRGRVGEIVDHVLKLVTGDDQVSVLTDEHTRVFILGVPEPELDDLELDSPVAVAGYEDDAGNFIARAIKSLRDLMRGLTRGEVVVVERDNLRINTPQGELTILTDEETRFRIPGVEEPRLNDVPMGSTVIVAWIKNEDEELLARMVGVVPERPRLRRVVAQISRIEGDTLTLTLRSGEQTDVLTDENTRFLVPGLIEAGMADLNVGDTVAAQGLTPQDDPTPYANVIVVLRDPEGARKALVGMLTAIDGLNLTLELRSGEERQLLTDEKTQFFVRGVDEGTLEDLNVGEVIGAQVVDREDGALYASAIATGGALPKPRQGAILGRIEVIDGDTIKLRTRRGEITVHTDANTHFRLPRVEEPSIHDLNVGQIIGAVGSWKEDGSLHAQIIGGRAAQPDASPDSSLP